MAGAEGFEPPLAVLETAGLAVKPMPLMCPNFGLLPLQPTRKTIFTLSRDAAGASGNTDKTS